MKKIEAVIFDVDGTLADNRHRQHLAPRGASHGVGAIHKQGSWKEFFDAMHLDVPNEAVAWLARLIWTKASGVRLILVTGRAERFRHGTEKWLRDHKINYDVMHMRGNDDYRDDAEVKKDILDRIRENHEVLFSVDDRASVVNMWRDNGVTTFALPDLTT